MWLPLLNFLVICATLVYQAPLQLLLPGQRTGKVRFVGALNSSRSLPLGCSDQSAVLCVMLPHATLHCHGIRAAACSYCHVQECSIAHIIGLFRLDYDESLLR